jgi:hypothetical protein
MIAVWGMDTNENMYFSAKTGYEAMEKALYTLNLEHKDPNAKIIAIGKNGRVLTMTHCGNTYSTLADGSYKG